MKTIYAKKFLACLMAMLVLLTSISIGMVSAEASGNFEYEILTEYDENGEEINNSAVIFGYSGNESVLTIPEEIDGYPVVGIGYGAFDSCTTLTSVTVPQSVLYIDGWAFEHCENLAEINLPDSLENIGCSILYDTAYYEDESNWEDGILYLDKFVVDTKYDLESDIEIKEGTTIISELAFYDTEITSVKLPSSLKIIGGTAFNECQNLTEIEIPYGVETIGYSAFEDCINLTSITVPDSVITIPDYFVAGCESLKEFTIPESVKEIGMSAFENTGIEEINIPASVELLYSYTFSNCTGLSEITVDSENPVYYSLDGVLYEKSSYEFLGDTLLFYPSAKEGEAYSLPPEIEYIDYMAFYGCQNLKEINIHENALYVDLYDAFSVEEINIAEENPEYKSVDGILFSKNSEILYCYPCGKDGESYTTDATVTYVLSRAFSNNSHIKELTFSEGVNDISYLAIDNCENLETVNLPSTITSLGWHFVSDCNNLTAINFNGTIAQWNALAAELYFEGSKGLYVYCTDGEIELAAPNEETNPTEGDTSTTSPEFTEPESSTPAESTSTDPTEPTASDNSGTNPPADTEYELGDANMDKKLNIRDATLIQKHLAKITQLDETALALADFTQDGKINIKDATNIQKRIAGII